jgi:hypothetical protein
MEHSLPVISTLLLATAGPVLRRRSTLEFLRCGPTGLALFAVLIVALPSLVLAQVTGVQLLSGFPGTADINSTLMVALPIANNGTVAATDVEVTSAVLRTATLVSPTTFPVALGNIAPGQNVVFQANFNDTNLAQNTPYVLTIQGTYKVSGATAGFTVDRTIFLPRASPGSETANTTTIGSQSVSGAPFPPQPPGEFEEANSTFPNVPSGPGVPGAPTGPQIVASTLREAVAGVRPFFGGRPVTFNVNQGLGLNGSTTAEPSGANGGGVVFVTFNWSAAYSTDGGSTFTQLDPTTIFPNDAVGFCCDQIVQYVPAINRFIWLLQGRNFAGIRIASASPATIISSKGTAWTYWNLTTGIFGVPSGPGFDYPDLSVGTNNLYMSWDVGAVGGATTCPNGASCGRLVARTPLSELQAGGTIDINYTHPADSGLAWGAHLSQNTQDEIFWAGHNGNTKLRVWSWAEGTGTYFWRDIGISQWANNALTSTTPDNQNWLAGSGGFPGNAVLGATRAPGPPGAPGELFSDGIWFAWDAGTNSNFQQPHVEMVTLDRGNNFSLIQQVQIWNNGYAFAYPALATNACTGEVGLSLEYGGNGNYENHVVGFWGDFIVYITTNSNVGTTRFGDYVTIRQDPTPGLNGAFFDAFGYGLDSVPPPGSGTSTDIHYLVFGRGGACSGTPR